MQVALHAFIRNNKLEAYLPKWMHIKKKVLSEKKK